MSVREDRRRAWRPPTRRAFVAMLGAAAAAFAIREHAVAAPPEPPAAESQTGSVRVPRWIGHC